jgi:hypothetical protein
VAHRINRRRFLKHTAAGAAGLVVLADARSAWTAQANDKMNVALIGLGGRGLWFVRTMPKLSSVVALCDVSDKKATVAHRELPDQPKYYDFRRMLDREKAIEGVVIATPDLTHAVATATAVKAGKHVYCEKPLTRTVWEARTVRDLARKHKVATEMGNQGTASGGFRRGVELIRDGTLGEIKEVIVWNNAGGRGWTETPTETAKVPDYLKWDLWLGPATFRPFHPRWMAWHQWRYAGTCQLGNWASHSANLAFKALKIDSLWSADPSTKPRIRLQAEVEAINRVGFPKWEIVRYEVPARGNLPPVKVTWYNGGSGPGVREEIEEKFGERLHWGDAGEPLWRDHAGTVIVGSKGRLHANAHNTTIRLLPEEKFKGVERQRPQRLPASRGHERDWLLAADGGPTPWSNFDYAGPLIEFLMLGNVATQVEGGFAFDPLACRIVDNEQADGLLRPAYRDGWAL